MTLVQEAMSIMETMPRKKQKIVVDLLREMSSPFAFQKQPVKNTETKMRVLKVFVILEGETLNEEI